MGPYVVWAGALPSCQLGGRPLHCTPRSRKPKRKAASMTQPTTRSRARVNKQRSGCAPPSSASTCSLGHIQPRPESGQQNKAARQPATTPLSMPSAPDNTQTILIPTQQQPQALRRPGLLACTLETSACRRPHAMHHTPLQGLFALRLPAMRCQRTATSGFWVWSSHQAV